MKSNTEEFINKCKKKFGDSFTYGKTSYTTAHGYVCITCPKHGDFMTIATNFLSRGKCPKCTKEENLENILKERFIAKAKRLYGDLYNYDKVKYTKSKERTEITCKRHGAFYVSPDKFLQGQICPKCAEVKKESFKTSDFISKCKEKYGDKYSYGKTTYVNNKTRVTITCNVHGDFSVLPNAFLDGHECKSCDFSIKASKVHEGKYRYDKVKYINSIEPIVITCPKHGDFTKTPTSHLRGSGCYKCHAEESLLMPFIIKAEKVHDNRYDYSKVDIERDGGKVTIECPIHGDFSITPNNHLRGRGCPRCIGKYKTIKELVNEFRAIHGNKYNYDKVKYTKSTDKVTIVCPKHGEFKQSPNKHLNGRGCPICKQSHLEREVRNELTRLGIRFEQEKRIGNQRLDFFIPSMMTAIECQGVQHFSNKNNFGSSSNAFNKILFLDEKKNSFCKQNNIKLFYLLDKRINVTDIVDEDKFKFIYTKSNIIQISDIEKIVK